MNRSAKWFGCESVNHVCVLVKNIITSFVAMLFSICLVSLPLLAYTFYQRRILIMDFVVWIYPSTIWLFLCYAFSSILGFSLIPAFRATQVNVIDTIREAGPP